MDEAADADRQAIMQVVEDETAAFWDRDYEAWGRCWVQSSYARRFGWWTQGGLTRREGWDEIGPRMKKLMEEQPAPKRLTGVRRENFNIRVAGDMAWMTFDEYAPEITDADFQVPGRSHETRILERHEGEWRIAYSCYLYRTLEHLASALIRVNANSHVEWINPAAEKAIQDGCGLAVWSGRLRATNRAADQRLQAGIGWAAHLDSGVESRRGTLPIVLEGGRGQPASVCWVIGDSGQIHISINDQRLAEERLETAAVVYGLSPSQVRLAQHIIAGQNLRHAAERLGVGVTTVRTQLERMFDKTGVRTQPALVRALLSVSAAVE